MLGSISFGRKAAAAGFALALAASLGGALAAAAPAYADEGTQTMYRLYNPNSGEHFYTSSADEQKNLISAGWNDEGTAWTAPTTSNTPVYRLYNPNPDPVTGSGEHHYTTSLEERDSLVAAGWLDEGTGWYSDDDEGVPVYRQYNPNQFNCNHNYTTSVDEMNYLLSIGWKGEGICWYGVAESSSQPTMNDVARIQAYTGETIYGTGVTQVVVTYKNGVDLSGLTKDSYILEDRGSLSPDFAQIALDSIQVNGQEVTLIVSDASQATENNKLVYTGDNKEGSRVRNAVGIYCTGAWYRDVNGTIYYGSDDTDAYENNTTGMGYQARETLELKLRHANEAADAAECLADEATGKYNASGKWLETIDTQFGEGKFQSLADAGILVESTAKDVSDGTADQYVRGYIYVPENYDPANGLVVTLQGQGISYWQLPDGTNNDGTGIMYDSATTSWADNGAIVVNIHDRSSAGAKLSDELWAEYDYVVDDANVMKYLIEKYSITGDIVVQGNSRGTMASSTLIKALAGQPYNPQNQKIDGTETARYQLDKSVYDFTVDTFVCQNGTFGYQYTDADWAAVAATDLRVWAFDGEQDTNNIDNIASYTETMTAKLGAEWAAENVRLTGYTSNIYYPWGESDHSTTRMNGWYFDEAAYYGPDLYINDDGEIVYNIKLADGDTYTLECRGGAASTNKVGYEYTVYDDLFQEWALQ